MENNIVDNEPLLLCMATHADRYMAAEVPESEVRTFSQKNNFNLFRTANINEHVLNNNTIDGVSSVKPRFSQFSSFEKNVLFLAAGSNNCSVFFVTFIVNYGS